MATAITLCVMLVSSWFFYSRTVQLLTDSLHQRLLAIVTTGSAQFSAEEINRLQTESDWQKPEWKKVVGQLRDIRERNPDILFAYLFRKSRQNSQDMEFVADSHSLNPYANSDADESNNVDPNGDGIIDEVDVLQWPGQPYPTPPREAFLAYEKPMTNTDLYEDQWGKVLTGYAPIRNEEGETVAVLAVDIRAEDFSVITRKTLIPFLIFCFLLGVIIVCLSVSIMRAGHYRIQLLQELDLQKDKVLHMVAHQLKGPVSAIDFVTEMLLDGSFGSLTEEQKNNIQAIRTSSQAMKSHSSMVLDAAHISLGKQLPIKKEAVDLHSFIHTIAESALLHARKRQVRLHINVPSALPKANLDAKYTEIALENLLSNALKYTALKHPSGGGDVYFTVELKSQKLLCTVRDTGIGIPEKDKENIFKKLSRASNSGSEGTGLGLHVAMGAIESQGGTIRYESTENVGTTFFVELPLQTV